MMARCVTLAGSNLYLALDGSVLNAPIMTCVVSVTMAINIIYGTDFTESRHLEVTSRLKCTSMTKNYDGDKRLKTNISRGANNLTFVVKIPIRIFS